jgi:hypothetical protein
MKKKKKGSNHGGEYMDSEDFEDIRNLSPEDVRDARLEIDKEGEASQSEALAKSIAKMSEWERDIALKKLRREDILMSETVEYLLKRMLRTKS